tara:strand:+ start:1065 stop:1361 length:297 start_codon:yes stop_codon:yes gene_type:complete
MPSAIEPARRVLRPRKLGLLLLLEPRGRLLPLPDAPVGCAWLVDFFFTRAVPVLLMPRYGLCEGGAIRARSSAAGTAFALLVKLEGSGCFGLSSNCKK